MKANETEKPNVPWKFQLDIALVTTAAIFIVLRLVKIGLIFISPPGNPYQTAIFFIAYPLLAFAWGCFSRPLHYPLWATMVIGLIGFGAGLYYWSGINSLLYLLIYLPLMAVGFFFIKRFKTKSAK